MRLPRSLAGLVLLTASATTLAAQLPSEGLTWSLYGLKAGSCIHFLAPSAAVQDAAPAGFLAARADSTPGIHPALAREIASETQYASWTPSRLCWFAFDSVAVQGRMARNKIDARRGEQKPVAIGYWAAAVRAKGALGEPPVWAALAIFSNAGLLAQSLVPARYDVSSADFLISGIDGSTDTRYEVTFDKNLVGWDGHLGDPTPSERQADTLSVGQSYVRLQLSAELGDSGYAPAGNLRLSGKGKLAQAMAASPIRMLGPITSQGGTLTWHFKR